MAITLRAAGSITGANATSVTVSQPTGTANDDLLVAFIYDSATSGTSTAPDGWTPVVSAAGASGRLQIFYAVKGYSAGLPVATSWTWTGLTARCAGYIVGYYNASHSGLTGTATAAYAASGASLGAPSLTTGVNNAMVIGAFCSCNTGRTWSSESCATMGALSEANGSADQAYGSNCNMAVAAAILGTAGATGASTGTPSANTANVCALLALAPASAPSVTTSGVTNIGCTTASGRGNVTSDGGGLITERGICWNTATAPTTANYKTTVAGTTGIYDATISGLTMGSGYYVRAYAINAQGTTYGNEVTFTALNVPTVTVQDVTNNTTGTTATGNGNVTSDGGGGTVTDRGVCWGASANPTKADSYASGGTGTGVFTAPITGLSPGQLYHVRSYATNTCGDGYSSSEVTFTTPTTATVTAQAVTNNTTGTTATGNGNITSDGGSTVTDRGVCWSTSPSPTIAGDHSHSGSGTGTFTSDITGLSPGQLYYVRAWATNGVGTSYDSNNISFTSASTPTVTTQDVSDNTTGNSATGHGNVTDAGQLTVTDRGVCWSTSPSPTIAGDHSSGGTGTGVFTADITGLDQNQLYYVRAYATNSLGTSYGGQVTFTTPTTPTVTTQAVTDITSSTAVGHGNVTASGGVAVTERGVCWGTSTGPTTAGEHATGGTGTGEFTANIINLEMSTHYYVRAYAINSVGTSYGGEVEFDSSAVTYSGVLKVYNGTWVEKPVKVYSGGSFVQKPWKYWNGSEWNLIDVGL